MEKWVTRLVGLAVVAFVVWLVARNVQPPTAVGHDPLAVDGGGDASPDGATGLLLGLSEGGADEGGPLLLSDLVPVVRTDAALIGGAEVPPLPAAAPRQVRFAVVLLSYAGAQPSAGASHPAARTKSEARALAEKLVATAEKDFHGAVQEGDPGSSEDVGRVKQGILEPAAEYVLFTLPVNGVGGPVETPRGYWIVKRLE